MKDCPKLEGFWWVPSNPDQQLAGRLISDAGVAKLVLTIDSRSPSGPIFSNKQSQDYEVFHGRTTDGKLVTLLKCFDLNSSWSSSGIEKRVILANYVLVGGLVPDEALEQAFSKLSLKWPTLKRWFFRSGIDVEHDKNDFQSFKVTYKPQQKIRFEYANESEIEFAFGTDKLPMGGPLAEGIKFREIVWVELTSERPTGLGYFLERLNELVHFFSICILEYDHPEEVSLVGNFQVGPSENSTKHPPLLKVYFSSAQTPRSENLPHPIEVLIPYGSISEDLPKLLRNWASVADKLSPIRSLYFTALYGHKQYVESTFLSLAQAVEVLHRRCYGGTYIDPEHYDNYVKPKLRCAIPDDLPRDVKEAYTQRLTFFNEISLANRIKELCRNHESVLDTYVPDWNKIIHKIVAARNYYTHYSDAHGANKPDINYLVDATEFLRMLLELEMLLATGINRETLHNRARECQRYVWRFPRERAK